MPHIGDWRKYIHNSEKKKKSARVQNHPVHKFPPLPPKKKDFFSSAYQQISNKKG